MALRPGNTTRKARHLFVAARPNPTRTPTRPQSRTHTTPTPPFAFSTAHSNISGMTGP